MPQDPGFVERFRAVRSVRGPAVFGIDPSEKVLRDWGLEDTPKDLEHFVDLVLEAAPGAIGLVKPQSAFFERHGWAGVRALQRLVAEARAAGLLVVLDVKRGDIGSTNEAYAQAYLGDAAPLAADAITLTPYLGLGAMRSFLDAAVGAGAGLFVVTRSSNPEGRSIQGALHDDGRSVEQSLVAELAEQNRRVAPGGIGPFGAVFAPMHDRPAGFDLAGMGGLFLAPGVGAQGATLGDVAACFADCPDRVLVAASRSLLEAGPDSTRLGDALRTFAAETTVALGA